MRSSSLLIALFLAAVSLESKAAPEILPLDADELRQIKLESTPLSRDDYHRNRRLAGGGVLRA